MQCEFPNLHSVSGTCVYERCANKTGCNFTNTVPTLDDPMCSSQYAKYLCCSMCSGILDAQLSLYPSLNRDDKIFSGLYFGPIYTLNCGANPNILINKDSCNSANVLSYNDVVNQLQCNASFQPAYGSLAFNVTEFNPSSDTSRFLEMLTLSYINWLGLSTPSVVSVSKSLDNPFLYTVMIGYSGNSNNQTISTLSSFFGSSNYTTYLSQNNFAGASISGLTIFNNIGQFPQNATQPLPNGLSPQPLSNNPSPQSVNQSEPLPSAPPQPLPDNLSPEPNPLTNITTPEPSTSPVATSPTSTPSQSPIAPSSFASKSVVVSIIILFTSIILGLSF